MVCDMKLHRGGGNTELSALGPALPGMQPCVHTAGDLLGQMVFAPPRPALSIKFTMGCHNLPNVSGRWARVPRAQRLCLQCAQQVSGDERHRFFECPALQFLRDRYHGLFGAAIVTHAALHVAI